jgi:hypothetical protein
MKKEGRLEMITESQIQEWEKKVLSRIGSAVKYKMTDGREKKGILKDRVVSYEWNRTGKKVYFNVIDLIEFDYGKEIRFGYYIGDEIGLRWGSRSTISLSKEEILNLFKGAMNKSWFREIIKQL